MKADRAEFIYDGIVENGKLRIYAAQTLKRDAAQCFDGMEVQLTLKVKKRKRSNKQLRYYWAVVVPIIRDALREQHGVQYESQEIHDFLKSRLNSEAVVNESTAEVVHIPLSTGKLTTKEMADFTERVRQWSEEFLDTVIPLPNEQREMDLR